MFMLPTELCIYWHVMYNSTMGCSIRSTVSNAYVYNIVLVQSMHLHNVFSPCVPPVLHYIPCVVHDQQHCITLYYMQP
ncbi:hypothetical protein XELAEV_18043715mg [Xenopus laevis]|uniref:Uncharacterized protein n=1 Tax=Xenopus laevis TaxID=8355 RepID=A0A974H2M3_XENLA|nr:hypothetical protein XELAEV_18043715mg [Xenopus laevis]